MEGPRAACSSCRTAHKGCDRTGPPCSRCIEFGVEDSCTFPSKYEKNNGAKGSATRKFKLPLRKRPAKFSREKIISDSPSHSGHIERETVVHPFPRANEKIRVISEEENKELFDLVQAEGEVTLHF